MEIPAWLMIIPWVAWMALVFLLPSIHRDACKKCLQKDIEQQRGGKLIEATIDTLGKGAFNFRATFLGGIPYEVIYIDKDDRRHKAAAIVRGFFNKIDWVEDKFI